MKHIELSAHEARFIRAGVALAPYTTFKIGGKADFFAEVTSVDELREAFLFAHMHELPVFILGGGSNVLVADEGFRGLILQVHVRGITAIDEGTLIVGAGEMLDDVVRFAVLHGLWGVENLSAIPGTVGGAAVQNAGAYGVELASSISNIEVYDTLTNEVRTMSPTECQYGYRESIFKTDEGKHFVIVHVTLALSKRPKPQLSYKDLAAVFPGGKASLEEIRAAVVEIRAAKFPDLKQYGTAGSFFKNPVISEREYVALQEKYPLLPGYIQGGGMTKIPIAWILDNLLAMRGAREGDVGAWETQPLVLTNYGAATAHAMDAFAKKIAHDVYEATGIEIEREVIQIPNS